MVGEARRSRHRTEPRWRRPAAKRPPFGKKVPCDKDLALAVLEFALGNRTRDAPMEAEQLNQIANTLADLKTRSAEMRRYL